MTDLKTNEDGEYSEAVQALQVRIWNSLKIAASDAVLYACVAVLKGISEESTYIVLIFFSVGLCCYFQ